MHNRTAQGVPGEQHIVGSILQQILIGTLFDLESEKIGSHTARYMYIYLSTNNYNGRLNHTLVIWMCKFIVQISKLGVGI